MFPVNNVSLVNRLGELSGMDLDQVFSLINTDTDSSKKHPFPCPTSYRTALTHYLEITAIPRTHVLKELAEYCSDEAVSITSFKVYVQYRFLNTILTSGQRKAPPHVVDECRRESVVFVMGSFSQQEYCTYSGRFTVV